MLNLSGEVMRGQSGGIFNIPSLSTTEQDQQKVIYDK